jgi:hypothetical protein
MTDETAKILADALTKLNKNIGALADLTLGIGEHVKVQTENTELLLRAVTARGVEEAADIAKSLPLKKRQKMYDEIVAKLRAELKLDEKTEKPAEPVVETPPTHDE